jgi:hypothetical protein
MEGDDPRPDAESFEAELSRIEAELRALFDRHGELAGPVPDRLVRLAAELDRLRAQAVAADRDRGLLESSTPPAGEAAPAEEEAGADREQR